MNPSNDELYDIPEGLRPLRPLRQFRQFSRNRRNHRRNAIITFGETYRQFYNRLIVPISTATQQRVLNTISLRVDIPITITQIVIDFAYAEPFPNFLPRGNHAGQPIAFTDVFIINEYTGYKNLPHPDDITPA
tara:strand:- start:323 stop:721 length:399 start_codon:yes stop_codon:yes gene_type:complete